MIPLYSLWQIHKWQWNAQWRRRRWLWWISKWTSLVRRPDVFPAQNSSSTPAAATAATIATTKRVRDTGTSWRRILHDRQTQQEPSAAQWRRRCSKWNRHTRFLLHAITTEILRRGSQGVCGL